MGTTAQPRVLLDGIVFPEGPRWHEGRLWFSDMLGGRVMAVDLHGVAELLGEFELPSGLGFLPDGTPLVALMRERRLMRLDAGGWNVHADLREYADFMINDMVVGGDGRAYVGAMAADRKSGGIVLVEPDGSARSAVAATPRPNGMAISPDSATLYVSETADRTVGALSIGADGTLSARRTFAVTGEHEPDGLCLDAQGALWVAGLETSEFRRYGADGSVLESVSVPGKLAVACMLGGPDRRTLFLATARGPREELWSRADEVTGFIEQVEVAVAGAGWP